MNKTSFMKKYTAFFDSIGKSPTNPSVDADTLKWLPLMFIVVCDVSTFFRLTIARDRHTVRTARARPYK
jgi:hypothetical protein